jgi:transposase-like protein
MGALSAGASGARGWSVGISRKLGRPSVILALASAAPTWWNGGRFDCSTREKRGYPNNLIEQDHRGVKLRIGPMLGFKRFSTAAITIAGIELLRRIHKGQFNLGRLRIKGRTVPEIWNTVLAAV